MEVSLDKVELSRLQLERRVADLQALLKHWRIWEAEYEGLKEGLEDLDDDTSAREVRAAAEGCEGDLLTTSEIQVLIEKNSRPRKPSEITALVNHRIGNVQQNVKILEKRLEVEQEKLDKLNLAEYRDESGLPLMEITEELDENDNVISSSVVKPGDAAPQLLDVLRKGRLEHEQGAASVDPTIDNENHIEATKDLSISRVKEDATPSIKRKKSVKFVDEPEIKELPATEAYEVPRKVRFATGINVVEEQPITEPVIPEDESEEDAALRREMLAYSMRDIGTVVAELDIEDEDDDEGENIDGDYEQDEEEDYEEEEEDEMEDEFGRTTAQVISDSYRKRMLELEKKLKMNGMISSGSLASRLGSEDIRDPASNSITSDRNESMKLAPEGKKEVRFAQELEIQDAPATAIREVPPTQPATPTPSTISEKIVERLPVEEVASPPGKKKVSRFKASRTNEAAIDKSSIKASRYGRDGELYPELIRLAEDRDTMVAQSAKSLTKNVIEKDPAGILEARQPDDLDPELHAAEVRNSYHRMRNSMIQRENGFMNQNMEEYEDEHGKQSISRFKAARLAREVA